MSNIKPLLRSSLIMLMALSASACISQTRYNECLSKLESRLAQKSMRELVDQDFKQFRELTERSLVARAKILKTIEEVKNEPEGPIGAKHVMMLKEGTSSYLELRSGLIEIAENNECFFYMPVKDQKKNKITNNQWSRAAFISLASAFVLYDNYVQSISLFNQDYRLRNMLNEPDSGFQIGPNELISITYSANSVRKRHRIRAGIKVYEEWMDAWSKTPQALQYKNPVKSDPMMRYLNSIIVTSPSYNFIKHWQVGSVLGNKLDFLATITADSWRDVEKFTMGQLSKFFGNTMGVFESRKGKLFGDKTIADSIREKLRAGDVLLEKTPFRLTDSFIPGHFGHVAIWSGTEAELKVMGIWGHQAVVPYQDKVQTGHQVIEALRSGVEINTLDQFMNIDDFAAIRPVAPDFSASDISHSVTLAFRQVGKDYDFNFDVDTTDKIVCSELAFQAYPQVQFETSEMLGRQTINPDQVAKTALNGRPFELITFYHDGLLVDPTLQLQKMEQLMTEGAQE